MKCKQCTGFARPCKRKGFITLDEKGLRITPHFPKPDDPGCMYFEHVRSDRTEEKIDKEGT